MVTTSNFVSTVERAFRFLVDVYGFRMERPVVAGFETWVAFTLRPVEVVVAWEQGAGSHVSLRHATPGVARGEYGLHELQQEQRARPGGSVNPLDTLEEKAAYLERNGSAVLRGDFTLLFERDARHRSAVARNTGGSVV